jgi:5-hydroxyisourate hydrolase
MSSISSHVLDTAQGLPAQGVRARLQILELVEGTQHWTTLAEVVTDADGRIPRFLPDGPLKTGTYRVCFDTKTYLETTGRPVFYPQIDVVFAVDGSGGEEHYHVPLLLSPFGYSTYRGS